MKEQTFKTPPALGPRLVGLAILCATLFALATVVGMFANGLA
jgi:hypothetical protein